MRKRSKYKPKLCLADPLAFALESSQLLIEHSPEMVLEWKIKNTVSFGNLMRGEASRKDIDNLVSARNITEALLVVCGVKEDDGTLARSACALIEICDRYAQGKKALRASEIQSIRDLLPLHDELMDVVTVKQFEKALAYARKEIRAGKAQQLKAIT